jgi:hypothetical protein
VNIRLDNCIQTRPDVRFWSAGKCQVENRSAAETLFFPFCFQPEKFAFLFSNSGSDPGRVGLGHFRKRHAFAAYVFCCGVGVREGENKLDYHA